MKQILIFVILVIFELQISYAQKKGVYTKADGSIKYKLQLKEGNKFIFENTISAHGTIISLFEVGVFYAKNDSIILVTEKSGISLSELKPLLTLDTVLAIADGRKKIYYFGKNGTSVKLKRE
jgi:hypothetical protein